MDYYGVIAIGFLVFYLFVGIWAGRNTKTVADHYVMSRSAPAFLITGTLVASNLSSVTFIGFTGTAIKAGPHLMIAMFGMTVIASLCMGLWIGKYFYRLNLMTVPDFFQKRYPSKSVQLLASLIVLISMTVYMVSVMLGSTVAAQSLFGWSPKVSLIAILSIITLFTVIGGMRSVVITDAIMFVIFLLGALVIGPAIILKLGGMHTAIEKATQSIPHIFSWHGKMTPFKGFMILLETNIVSLINVAAAPHLLSRISIAKSEREFGKAMLYLAVSLPILIIGLLYTFGYLPALNSQVEPVNGFPWVARNLVPAFIGAIGLSGVLAAAISTTTSLFQQASATLSSDLIKTYLKPDMTNDQLLSLSRWCVVIIAVVVYAGSLTPNISAGSIMYAFLFATACFSAWLPSLILGVLWKGATTKGAFYSMAISLPLIVALGIARKTGLVPGWLAPNVIGLVVSTGILVIVSKLTQASYDQELIFESIR